MSDAAPQPPFDSQAFREALGCYPIGVTIVTAVGPRREIIADPQGAPLLYNRGKYRKIAPD